MTSYEELFAGIILQKSLLYGWGKFTATPYYTGQNLSSKFYTSSLGFKGGKKKTLLTTPNIFLVTDPTHYPVALLREQVGQRMTLSL